MTLPLVTDETFDSEVLQSDKPVLVEFSAEWCQPCKTMAPLLAKFAVSHPEFKVVTVDVDESYEVTKRYKVRGAPTFIVFKNGLVCKQSTGTTTEAKLFELFQ
jgi:thioredoxin 1